MAANKIIGATNTHSPKNAFAEYLSFNDVVSVATVFMVIMAYCSSRVGIEYMVGKLLQLEAIVPNVLLAKLSITTIKALLTHA
jgi:hypothetical protein